MANPLEQRLATLRARVRRLVVLYGVSWVVAAVIGTAVVLGITDYLIHFQDRGLRVICSLLVLAALGWALYRFLYLPMCVRLSNVKLALKLQQRFPNLEDRLVSSVEFLRQGEADPAAGSPELRRAVIAQTTAETDLLDFGDALDRRQPVRAAMISGAIVLAAAILVVCDFSSSQIAVARLINPFSSQEWPRKNHLKLVKKIERIARGGTFELEVIDQFDAKLPSGSQIFYRFENPDGSMARENELMRYAGSRLIARRENVVRPFSYRVTGGDDTTMLWTRVEVLEPPVIESLSIRLVPPPYTAWPAEPSGRNIRALVGTRLEMTATVTKPLESALLCLAGNRRVRAGVSKDGLQFTIPAAGTSPVVIERSGPYRFTLIDQEGLEGGDREQWEIRAVPDSPPSVTIERPVSNVFVTPKAKVPIRVSAKDDLAIRTMALVFERPKQPSPEEPSSDDEPEGGVAEKEVVTGRVALTRDPVDKEDKEKEEEERETALPLFTGPEKLDPQPPGALAAGADRGDLRVVDYRWDLASLNLLPGTQLSFHAAATDYHGETGKSEPRRLIVITAEELQDRIASRQNQILGELARALKLQRSSRSQVGALEIRLGQLGRLEQLDVDHLQAAELNQRNVNRMLTSQSEGVPMHILALVEDLDNNQVDSPDVRRRMKWLLDELERLEREHLTLIGRELTAGIKAAQVNLEKKTKPPKTDADVAVALKEAGEHQDAVIASLEKMLGELGRWDNYRRFHREIRELQRDQEDIARRTTELGQHTLTKDVKDLKPEEVADLKILAGRQLELARNFDRIQQGMQKTIDELRDSDPLAAETVADALAEAHRLAVSGKMRTAGAGLRDNRIGQTVARQKKIVEDLDDLLDILANRRESELVRLVKKLEEAEADLDDLARRQDAVKKGFEQNAQQPDGAQQRKDLKQLTEEQQRLQKETEQLARRLERLLAQKAAQTAAQAAEQMGQAGQNAGKGQSGQAQQRAGEAKKSLDKTKKELAQRRQQAELELVMEMLAKLEDAVKHLTRQQKNVIDETKRLDGLRRDQGQLTRAQTTSLQQLAGLERSLQGDVGKMREKLAGAGAFQLALGGVHRDMGLAAARLDRRQTGAATVQAEENALRRLDMLCEALKQDEPGESDDGGAGGSSPGQQPGGQAGGVHTLAELKLMKLLQLDINLRTADLQATLDAGGELSDARQREYLNLSEEQGRLATLLIELIQPAEPDPEDDIDNLPDMRQEKPSPPEEDLP